ncbi:MAG TPA: S-formylglutathione hydrolase [Gammaproteobacteria bacterium]|nr:S-formylglutathione hydrolase [Gammaproteobacteria bacterium]
MTIQLIEQHKCFGGTQAIYSHLSTENTCEMRFGIFIPPQAESRKVPVLYWLSGLTCTEENFITKAGAQRIAAELGLIIVVSDTSPRNLGIPGEEEFSDFGTGAGFYVDATQKPWSKGYRMYSYICKELTSLVELNFNADPSRVGIFGHSMGGHGALMIALKNPHYFKSVSAFAPICSPIHSPWGIKAFTGYLGSSTDQWEQYDATRILEEIGWKWSTLFIDQGTCDPFLKTQLKPEILIESCEKANVSLKLRMQEGYDHSYFFVTSFIEDHLRFHAENLLGLHKAA